MFDVLFVFENECSVRSLAEARLGGRASPGENCEPASMPETDSCLTRRVCCSGFERYEFQQAFLRRSSTCPQHERPAIIR
jgi:hypothetical protein